MNLQDLIKEKELKLGDKVECVVGCRGYCTGLYTIVPNSSAISGMGIIDLAGMECTGVWVGYGVEFKLSNKVK